MCRILGGDEDEELHMRTSVSSITTQHVLLWMVNSRATYVRGDTESGRCVSQ
jgi:hypothetical protein